MLVELIRYLISWNSSSRPDRYNDLTNRDWANHSVFHDLPCLLDQELQYSRLFLSRPGTDYGLDTDLQLGLPQESNIPSKSFM